MFVAIGILGLVAMTANDHTREVSIRVTLGARPGAVVRQLIGEQLRVVIAGTIAGGLLAAWGTRFVQSHLYETATYNLTVWAMTVTVIFATATIGAWIPAQRAGPSIRLWRCAKTDRIVFVGSCDRSATEDRASRRRSPVGSTVGPRLLIFRLLARPVRSLRRVEHLGNRRRWPAPEHDEEDGDRGAGEHQRRQDKAERHSGDRHPGRDQDQNDEPGRDENETKSINGHANLTNGG